MALSDSCSVRQPMRWWCRPNRLTRTGDPNAFSSVAPLRTNTSLLANRVRFTLKKTPVVHASKPLLAYNCLEHKFSIDTQGKERHSGCWDSVRLFDLELGIETVPVSPKTIQLPPGIARGWIAGLVSFSESGLYVQAGLATDESNMEYVLAEIDLGMRRMVPVAKLPAVFM